MTVGYCISKEHGIVASNGDRRHRAPYLDWFMDHKPDDPNKVFYNLDADVAGLLSLIKLTRSEGEKLYRTNKLRIQGLTGVYALLYNPKGYFGIIEGHGLNERRIALSNMSRYMKGLDTALNYQPGFDPLEKAREAVDIAEQVTESFKRLGLSGDKIGSPIGEFSKKYFPQLRLPTSWDESIIPMEASELAYRSMKSNWLECWKVGYWGKVWDYDLINAYGSELVKLHDLANGSWVKSLEKPPGALYGYVEGIITVDSDFSPFLLKNARNETYSPIGSWFTVLTMAEIDFLNEYKLGEFEPINGIWWIPKGAQRKPYEKIVKRLFEVRDTGTDLDKEIVKRVTSGLWGYQSQILLPENVAGEYHCSPYATEVETNVRLKVARACLDNNVQPLSIAVDGVVTDRPLDLELGHDMGDWRLSHVGRCIIVNAGIVALEGKHGLEEFSLRFSWLHDEMTRHPEAQSYTQTKMSPMTLGKALNTNSFNKLGTLQEVKRDIHIGEEHKRLWPIEPVTGADILANVYDSLPLTADIIAQHDYLLEEDTENIEGS